MPRKSRFQHRKKQLRARRMHCEPPNASSSLPPSPESPSTTMVNTQPEPSLPISSEVSLATTASTSQTLISLHSNILLPIIPCKVTKSQFTEQLHLSHCLTVHNNYMWTLFVHNHRVTASNCPQLSNHFSIKNAANLNSLLTEIDKLTLCSGQPDTHFVDMVTAKKCQIMSNDVSIKAYIDSVEVEFDGQAYPKTVRTSACGNPLI